MYVETENGAVGEAPLEPRLFTPHARFWPQTDRIEVILSPRQPRVSIYVSDEIQVHLARGILGRSRLVGFTIHGIGAIQRKCIRQNHVPFRGTVNISSVLRVLHQMEHGKKKELLGKYRRLVERALEKHLVTVSL